MPEQSERSVGMGVGLGSALANTPDTGSPLLMAEDILGVPGLAQGVTAPPRGRAVWKRLGWGFWVAVALCTLWILAAIFAGLLPLPNPDFAQLNPGAPDYCFQSLGHPYSAHLLGCDPNGRDILSRVIYGSRVSLIVGFGSIAMGGLFGGVLGIISGYFRGWIDEVLSVLANVFLSFPSLVLALVIVSFLGRTQTDIILIIAVVAWPLLFRVVRAATIEYSQREYVLAAQALGSKPSRILRTLLLPDVVPSAITYGLVGVALAIIAEGALSFVGQSVAAPTPTWGNMIYEGSQYITQDVTLLIVPAIAMFSFILPINYIGDRLRQVLDNRQGVI